MLDFVTSVIGAMKAGAIVKANSVGSRMVSDAYDFLYKIVLGGFSKNQKLNKEQIETIKLRRESNGRFGFSFVHPFTWDRQDPTNGDGNTFRHPKDPRIQLAAWGRYAVLPPDLHSWIEFTLEHNQKRKGYRLIARVPAGGHLVDWEPNTDRSKPTIIREQIEGCRIVFKYKEGRTSLTVMETFLQYDNTQIGITCQAPSACYKDYEDLFLVISKKLRFLGASSAPFARGQDLREEQAIAAPLLE